MNRPAPRLLAALVLAACALAGCAHADKRYEIGRVGSVLLECEADQDLLVSSLTNWELVSQKLDARDRPEAAEKLRRIPLEGRDWCERHGTREVPVWQYEGLSAKAAFTEDGETFFLVIILGDIKKNRDRGITSLTEEQTAALAQALEIAPERCRTVMQGF